MRSAAWVLAATVLGCSGAPPQAPAHEPRSVSVAPPEKTPDPEPPPPTGPLVLDVGGERARFLDTAAPASKRYVYDTLLASGDHAAVTRTSVGEYFGYDESLGVIGALDLPAGTKKVLFGPADSVLVVTDGGKLFAAASLTAAKRAQSFEPRVAPEKVTAWDSAGDYLVAADDKQVHLSRDGGKTWTGAKSAAWGTLRTVVVRSDGVMAVQGGPPKAPLTFLSRDDGKSWQRSSFQPDRISRSGSFIWSDVWNCQAVLSENGSTWTKGGDELARFRSARSWSAAFGTGATPEGAPSGAHRTLTDPPAPKVPPAKDRRTGRGCPAPPRPKGQYGILGLLGTGGVSGVLSADGEGFGSIGTLGSGTGVVGGIGVGGIGHRGMAGTEPAWGSCRGAACLRPLAQSLGTRSRFELFRDGRCAPGTSSRSCSDAFERPPHVAIIDNMTGKRRVADLPAGCMPRHLLGVAGLGILVCGGARGLTLHVADSSGVFKEEGTLPDAAMTRWPVQVAADGTLLFHETCGERSTCRALVRRPVDPGTAGAFRELKVERAAAFRILTRGRALVVVRGSGDTSIDLVQSSPEGDGPLVRGLRFEGDLIDLRVDERGRVIARERRSKTESESFVVGVDAQRHPL
ncbi:MAG: hypothetical protein IT377_01020 [Polyangiaceae bacterium]|nr:hypothetical protein [Polyangiaceae bacterium]